jgi:DNA-binding CsgD family transcriptional regulator
MHGTMSQEQYETDVASTEPDLSDLERLLPAISDGLTETLEHQLVEPARYLAEADVPHVEPWHTDDTHHRVVPMLAVSPPRTQDRIAPMAPLVRLTPRELEVATLMARGLRNRDIARALVITPKTAANHVQRVLDKLGLASRAEVAARAEELGLRPTTTAPTRQVMVVVYVPMCVTRTAG